MSEKPSPTAKFFLYNCVVAHQKMLSGSEPKWFREHFHRDHINEEYGIPAELPLVFALALDLTLTMPSATALKALSRKVENLRSRLRESRADVLALRRSILIEVGPDILDLREMPDGSMECERGLDPTDELIHAMDTYLEKLNSFGVGRRTSPVPIAVRKLDEFALEHNPTLTRGKREGLCEHLFDIVRKRHAHRSRSPDHFPGETPRYRDLLERSARRSPGRESATPSRRRKINR
jgi:hypothetical protein